MDFTHFILLLCLPVLVAGEMLVEYDEDKHAIKTGQGANLEIKSRPNKRNIRYLETNNYLFWDRMGECPTASDGSRQHFCPSPTSSGEWICVDDYELCDGQRNCPNAEDESEEYCLFYRVLKSQVELLTHSIKALTKETDLVEKEIRKLEQDAEMSQVTIVDSDYMADDDGQGREHVSRFHRQNGRFVPAN